LCTDRDSIKLNIICVQIETVLSLTLFVYR